MPEEFYECEDTLTPSQNYKYTNRPQWGWPHEDDNNEPNPGGLVTLVMNKLKVLKQELLGPSVVRTGRDPTCRCR